MRGPLYRGPLTIPMMIMILPGFQTGSGQAFVVTEGHSLPQAAHILPHATFTPGNRSREIAAIPRQPRLSQGDNNDYYNTDDNNSICV